MPKEPTGPGTQQLQFTDYGWPINPPGVGHGTNTQRKLAEFKAIAELNVRLVHNINVSRLARQQKPYPYFVLDPTSGPGGYIARNDGSADESLIGTPLRAALACHKLDPLGGYRLALIEQHQLYATCLEKRLDEMALAQRLERPYAEVMHGRYEDLLVPWVKRHVPQYGARGLIVPDPNGMFGFETLRELGSLKSLDRVDFAFHGPAALFKWHRSKGMPSLDEVMKICHKTQWLVGQVSTNWQWAWLFATNWPDYPELKKIGLVAISSDEGVKRLTILRETRSELKRRELQRLRELQPELGFDMDGEQEQED